MRLNKISLSDYLHKPVYKSRVIKRANGDRLLVCITDRGIRLVVTEYDGIDYSAYIKLDEGEV